MSRLFSTIFTIAIVSVSHALIAQNPPPTPRLVLNATSRLRLSGEVDSNSPAFWQRVNGLRQVVVLTSTSGRPSVSSGPNLGRLSAASPIVLEPWPGGGVWMESVLADEGGTLYGYYHNEVGTPMCAGSTKVVPRIGAARSRDGGVTWEPLGLVLEAPPGSAECQTHNKYFLGGVGDFSVQLDAASRDVYFFFSQYLRWDRFQGIGVARLTWADRDAPSGKAMVHSRGAWIPARSSRLMRGESPGWVYPSAVPIFPAVEPWHDDDLEVDAFWGPSVHWNTYLEQYVMLLNRARDANWSQEGIYVSFASRLDDPSIWSTPVKILNSNVWYPQVMGVEDGTGTDKVAGRLARLFVGGTSDHLVQFVK